MTESQKDWPVVTLWRKDGDDQITVGSMEIPDVEVDEYAGMRYLPESALLNACEGLAREVVEQAIKAASER